MDAPLFGGIESGGTKCVCAIGDGRSGRLLSRATFPTGDDPAALLAAVIAWLKDAARSHGPLAALGVASFGPLDLDERSPTYGFITTTPKRGWRQTDLLGPLRGAFPGMPIGFDTDVNGAALGEGRFGAAQGLDDFVYVTVGTGIGGGAIVRGRPVHGLVHPEMGHIPMPALVGEGLEGEGLEGDPLEGGGFAGACAIHGRCWEGLCAGPAIEARAGRPAQELAPDDPAWELTACAMAHALLTLSYVLSPRRIIVGGSVRKAGRLGEAAFFARMRHHFLRLNAGYIASAALAEDGVGSYIVPPMLGDDAGVCGALVLADLAFADATRRR